MNNRPNLNKNMDKATFQSYYYLKAELIQFCRQEGLQTSGGKADLSNRIAHYLDTGEKITVTIPIKRPVCFGDITADSLIESDFVCSEKHRAYFVQALGKGFTFNVVFQKWLKANAGKQYRDAIKAYHEIRSEKMNSKSVIDKQFEYNAYIRDFFAENKGGNLDEAIKCWTYKKRLHGHNRYEKTDLIALDKD